MSQSQKVTILGVFVADTAYRAERQPKMGETILGNSFVLGPGGKGSNQSVAAARAGADVSFITKLGEDAFAQMAMATWEKAGVKPAVTRDPASYTGAAYIFIEEATGNNAIIVAPGAAATISPADIEAQARPDCRIEGVHHAVGAADPGSTARARNRQGKQASSPSSTRPRPRRWTMRSSSFATMSRRTRPRPRH